ncbi:MAG: hypothetical protein ACP5OG_02970 [Candidatus Nanoarchaeia archaeon]
MSTITTNAKNNVNHINIFAKTARDNYIAAMFTERQKDGVNFNEAAFKEAFVQKMVAHHLNNASRFNWGNPMAARERNQAKAYAAMIGMDIQPMINQIFSTSGNTLHLEIKL